MSIIGKQTALIFMLPYLLDREQYKEVLEQIKSKGDINRLSLPYFTKVKDWWFSLEEDELERQLLELDPSVQTIVNFLIPKLEKETLEYCYAQ